VKQILKGVAAAVIVDVPLGLYLYFWLHAPLWFALLLLGILGSAIVAVVGTRSDASDAAADAAWREAAPDLPPVSDRRVTDGGRGQMPAPTAAVPQAAAQARGAKAPAGKNPAGRSPTT
jgi:hypothetical protein